MPFDGELADAAAGEEDGGQDSRVAEGIDVLAGKGGKNEMFDEVG